MRQLVDFPGAILCDENLSLHQNDATVFGGSLAAVFFACESKTIEHRESELKACLSFQKAHKSVSWSKTRVRHHHCVPFMGCDFIDSEP